MLICTFLSMKWLPTTANTCKYICLINGIYISWNLYSSTNSDILRSNCKINDDIFAAAKLGIKELLPAYLGTNLTNQDLITGVSFASGGTGYDPLTAKVAVYTNKKNYFSSKKEKILFFSQKQYQIVCKSHFAPISIFCYRTLIIACSSCTVTSMHIIFIQYVRLKI